MIKPRQTSGACDTHKGAKNAYRTLGGNQWKRHRLEAVWIDERIILKTII